MNEITSWIPLGGAVLLLLGTWITVRATRGKTQVDYKTAMEKRLDEKMGAYTDRLEKRLETAEGKAQEAQARADELEGRVDHLEDVQEASERREKLLYKYTSTLREHILGNKPPPPPRMPDELVEWYSSFETGDVGMAR